MRSVTGIGFPLCPFAFILSFGFILLAISFVLAIVRQFHPSGDARKPVDPIKGGEQV